MLSGNAPARAARLRRAPATHGRKRQAKVVRDYTAPTKFLNNEVGRGKSVYCRRHGGCVVMLQFGRRLEIMADLEETSTVRSSVKTSKRANGSTRMNTLFFKNRLKDRDISQRKLATLLKLDPAAITLMLKGERRMQPAEAKVIAELLGLPITQVLREAGVPVTEDVGTVPIAGSVDGSGRITLMPPGTHEMTVAPTDVPRDGYALQMRAFGDAQDGWVLFVSDSSTSNDDHLDRLCAVSISDGRAVVAFVRRGYRQGLHNLMLWPSREPLHDQKLSSVSPVLWLKPSR